MAEIVVLPVRSYRDLKVWQRSKLLALEVYKVTQAFPKEERYGLTSQLRRAAVSIPSNIAEGNARSTKDYQRFLDISLGSLAELETQLEIACALAYLSTTTLENLLNETLEIGRMLSGLIKSLDKRP